jgi:hypothetical protein
MTLPLLILIAVLSAFGTPATADIGGGVPTAAAAPDPGAPSLPPAPPTTDDIGGGVPTHH